MKKRQQEKIRDDLYVRKTRDGGYDVVYPLRDNKGNKIKGNLKKNIKREIGGALTMLIPVIAILILLLPGATQIKEQCEANVEYLINNSCQICNQQTFGDQFNFTLGGNMSLLEVEDG